MSGVAPIQTLIKALSGIFEMRFGKYEVTSLSEEGNGCSIEEYSGSVILCASWEQRSRELFKHLDFTKLNKVVLIRFLGKTSSEEAGNMRTAVKDRCRKEKLELIEIKVESTGRDFAYYHALVEQLALHVSKTPGRWMWDLSSFPRRLWTSLIFALDQLNTARSIQFYYAIPKYSLFEDEFRQQSFRQTEGEWAILDPPFSKPVFNKGMRRRNIISVGFEYDNLKNMLNGVYDEANTILYAEPGFTEEYTFRARDTVRRIQNVFSVPDKDLVKVAVDDVIGVCREAISILNSARDTGSDTAIICAGSKLHTLGLAIVKAVHSDVRFFIRVPKAYSGANASASGQFHLFELTNTLVPI